MTETPTTRREFLACGIALAGTLSACGNDDGDDMTSGNRALLDLSATDAIKAMRNGSVSAEAYASALLEQAVRGRALNAFITLEPDRVLEAARDADRRRAAGQVPGLLHGLPIPVKDSVNTRDYPTTGGSPALRHFVPAEDALLVRQLREAGAIVMGKTNVHELSFGWTSSNMAYGPVRNPYDPSRIPGGSSGGTAAAIAARMAPLGIAEDTQGSIRVPAALCGICGFRPTQNRYPNQGVVPITPLFDQVGPHARHVRDLALFDHVITGDEPVNTPRRLSDLRLGVPRQFFYADLDTEVARIAEETLAALAKLGVTLVDADVPDLGRLVSLTTAQVQSYHVKPMLEQYLDEFETGITFDELMADTSPDVKAAFDLYVLGGNETPSQDDFVAARDTHLPALRRTMAGYFADSRLDAMIFPTTQISATPIGEDTNVLLNGREVPFEAAISRNISPGSTAGLPGLVLPVALDRRGLPVSMEIDGPANADRALLQIGLALEDAFGTLPPPTL